MAFNAGPPLTVLGVILMEIEQNLLSDQFCDILYLCILHIAVDCVINVTSITLANLPKVLLT